MHKVRTTERTTVRTTNGGDFPQTKRKTGVVKNVHRFFISVDVSPALMAELFGTGCFFLNFCLIIVLTLATTRMRMDEGEEEVEASHGD